MPRTKLLLKIALGWLLLKLGLHRLLLKNRAVIVLFHRVGEAYPRDEIGIGVESFQRFCSFFRRYFRQESLTGLMDRLRKGEDLTGRLVITFDDGYLDNRTQASKILRENGLSACFFVATGFVDSEQTPGWDLDRGVRPCWMTWQQVREMRAEGFEIGAHTVNHVNLGSEESFAAHGAEPLPEHWGVNVGAETQAAEIKASKIRLEEELGEEIKLFSYPFGRGENITDENRGVVREVGFDCCASAISGVVTPSCSPFDLPRIAVGQWYRSPYQFVFELVMARGRSGPS